VVDRVSTSSRLGLSRQQESLVPTFYGACCHGFFVAGVATMMIMMFFGMSRSFGVLHAPWSYLANALLLAQFPLLHSMLLSRRGARSWAAWRHMGWGAPGYDNLRLDRLCPGLAALCLVVAERDGRWRASGFVFGVLCCLYAGAWLLLLKSIIDAGFALQIGLLGWRAVARHRVPDLPHRCRPRVCFACAGSRSTSPSR
jgi:hypothetical protein